MIFADVLPGLDALFASMSGLTASGFDGESPVYADDVSQASISVKILSMNRIGQDEDRSVYDADAVVVGDTFTGEGTPLGGFIPTFIGQRSLHVQVLVECELQDRAHTAWRYLEQCRDRLALPSSKDALSALGLAVAHLSDSRNLDYMDNEGRQVSAAAFDIEFNTASTTTEPSAPITTIETVDLRAEQP